MHKKPIGIPASELDWEKIPYLSPEEFPPNTLHKISSLLIEKISQFRTELRSGITPSPVPAGWIRTDGSQASQHYAVDRLSTAGDIFLAKKQDARYAFLLACSHFTGVGIYYDTKYLYRRIMLHVDLRETPTTWCRHKGKYYYPARGGEDAEVFFTLLAKGTPDEE